MASATAILKDNNENIRWSSGTSSTGDTKENHINTLLMNQFLVLQNLVNVLLNILLKQKKIDWVLD